MSWAGRSARPGVISRAAVGEIGLLSGMLTELQGSYEAAAGCDREVFRAAESSVLSGVQAGGDALEGVAGAAGDVEKAAPAAGEAASGLGGILGMLGERLSYVAIDPFMWMYAAPMVIQGVTAAVEALSGASSGYIGMLTKQDQATSYNISGYQELASQLSTTAQQYSESAQSVGSSSVKISGDAADVFTSVSQSMTQASEQASSTADNLTVHLGTLESQYGITQTQAEQLAKAAGVTAQQLAAAGTPLTQPWRRSRRTANANLDAQNPVNQLAQTRRSSATTP